MSTEARAFARLEGTPVAPHIGPFSRPELLEVMWMHTRSADQSLLVAADDHGGSAMWLGDDRMEMVGPEHLVDYRSPVGDPGPALKAAIADVGSGIEYRFDSLPLEAAETVAGAIGATEPVEHASTAVLALPVTYDDYLADLGKKERHETRRKIRRFGEQLGEPRVVTYDEPGPALQRFFALHRLADGRKAAFMTPAMTRLFSDLVALPGWRVDALYGDGPRSVAATVAYVDPSGYYLYNSAYDPTARDASPGVVLLHSLIAAAIDERVEVFDFLKGDEQYKYRMGAERRPLYAVEGTT